MKPLVSILIPAFNSENLIEASIKSAEDQTWSNKEIIIVDDGSTDSTLQTAKRYESNNLKVITQPNSGACAARNNALSIAQGDFIQWLDADDLLAPDKIERQLIGSDLSPDSKVLHSAGWGYFYHQTSRTDFKQSNLWHDLYPISWLQIRFGEGSFIPPHAWLVSRYLTETAGPWDVRLKRNQDGEYFCRVISCSEFIKFHHDAICYYRKGVMSSITMKRSKSIIESLDLANNLCVDYLLKLDDSETSRTACIKYLQTFINKIPFSNSNIINKNISRIVELGGQFSYVTETKKFSIFKIIFGKNLAYSFKKRLWNLKIRVKKSWDKILSQLSDGHNNI